MSMLVRKGTMLHRASTRRQGRRSSATVGNRQRSQSLVPAGTSLSSTATGHSGVSSPDRRMSRVTLAGTSVLTGSPSGKGVGSHGVGGVLQASSTPSLSLTAQSDSRRTSSATSQMSSGDDRKKLCTKSRGYRDSESAAITYYGSVSYQLRDASEEASGACDFVCRALEILAKTAAVSVFLLFCLLVALFMVIFGVQYLRDCPKEPNIPIYLLVGGCFGILKITCLLWRQSQCRRYERLDDTFSDGDYDESLSASTKITDYVLSIFLIVWFGMGNYWAFRIYKPRFQPLLLQPSNWCHQNVYTFMLVHIYFCYSVAGAFLFIVIILFILQKIGCF